MVPRNDCFVAVHIATAPKKKDGLPPCCQGKHNPSYKTCQRRKCAPLYKGRYSPLILERRSPDGLKVTTLRASRINSSPV